jgi:hypothetical protein
MKFIRRFFQGRINIRTYIVGVFLVWFTFFLIDLPIIIFLLERFTRPTYIPMTLTYIVLPILLPMIISLQILYHLSLNIRRKQDTYDSKKNKSRPELFLWEYIIIQGVRENNRYGKHPKESIDFKALLIG